MTQSLAKQNTLETLVAQRPETLKKLAQEKSGTPIAVLYTKEPILGETFQTLGFLCPFYENDSVLKLTNSINAIPLRFPPADNYRLIEIPTDQILSYTKLLPENKR